MSTIDAAKSTASAAPAAGSSAVGGSSGDQETRFLKLLVTQLKNQDPLNPMDNAQMTSQMAQMSQLQGIEKLNATMSKLAASLTGNQALQAAALVGRGVMVPGSTMQLAGGQALGGVSLAQAVDSLKVKISDASGLVVHTADLGAQPAGVVQITWDGMTDVGAAAADGSYKLSVSATAQGKAALADPLMLGPIYGVTVGTGGTTLNMGALGNVDLTQVKQFL